MIKPELGTNVQNLRRIYEPHKFERNLTVNDSNHSATSVFCHAMFTLTVIIIAVIFGTIIEHRRMLNIYWKTFLKIKLEIFNKMILKENTMFSFLKYLNNGEKAFGIITFINVAVYLAWNVTKWNSIMLKYLIINEDKPNSIWSLLFSAFSHTSLWSLTANVVYLYYPLCKLRFVQSWPISTFSSYMGIEEFFVMYISACLFSSLSKIYIEQHLNMSSSKHGASGPISAVFGYVALGFPNRKLLTISMFVRDERFAMSDSSDYLDCFRTEVIADQLNKHNFWMYFWNSPPNLLLFYLKQISYCKLKYLFFWYKLGSKIIWNNRKYLTNIFENNYCKKHIMTHSNKKMAKGKVLPTAVPSPVFYIITMYLIYLYYIYTATPGNTLCLHEVFKTM
ncbi:hypothetical protein ACI65C_007497 [Semiaphis heraclei]